MPTVLAFLIFLAASPAQAGQSPAPVTGDNLCTVQGVVIKAGTGEPLKKANVSMWADGGDVQRHETSTDGTGRFELKGVEPGRYRLAVQRNGYVRQEYGQTKVDGPGTYLSLSPGQTVSNITIQMIPAAAITGHVYDEDGDPVQGAQVSTLRSIYNNGQPELARAGSALTNDLGEFRIYGLTPGKYILEADKQPRLYSALKSDQGYVAIYYPGVTDAATATPITVQAGDEFPSADISLQIAQTVNVRGHVTAGSGGAGAEHAQIYLVAQGSSVSSRRVVAQTSVSNPQGAFELRNVAPGAYFICAYLYEVGETEFARQPIEVAESDVDGVNLMLARSGDIRGRLRVEGGLDSGVPPFHVSLAPLGGVIMFGGIPTDTMKPDGSFNLRNVVEGEYELEVDGMPADDYVRSARWEGVDALAAGVRVSTVPGSNLLDIVISPNGARIDGVVSNDGQPVSGARVTLVPDPPHRGEEQLFLATNTDQAGRFVLRGVAPGDYKLFAWESIEAGAYKSPDFLLPFENKGQSVHVVEGAGASVQLELIPANQSSQ